MFEAIVASVAANAIALAMLGLLFRKVIEHFLEKDVSKFKQSLELQAQLEIASYKAGLEKEHLRLQISYGGIFEKQAAAIHELYKGVVALERAASTAINEGGNVEERRRAFREPWAVVRQLFHDNRILLPKDIDDALTKFIDEMFLNVSTYTRLEMRDLGRVSDREFDALMEKQEKAIEVIERDLPVVRELLVVSMRRALGVAH